MPATGRALPIFLERFTGATRRLRSMLVSQSSLPQRLVKTAGRLIKHARYYRLLLAESHLTRRLFGSIVYRIAALPVSTG